MANQPRTIRDIRTAAGVTTSSASKHTAFMKLGSLELERSRNERQREVALRQAETCRRRCEQLQREINGILASIDHREVKPAARQAGPNPPMPIKY